VQQFIVHLGISVVSQQTSSDQLMIQHPPFTLVVK
jgi:hypothetical protein